MAMHATARRTLDDPRPPASAVENRPRWWRVCQLVGWLIAVATLSAIPAPAQRASEYEIKAAFLYSFPSFVEWSPQALPDSATSLTIGILGDDPFGDALKPFAGKTVHGRSVVIRRSTRLQELPLCHVLFICESERRYLPQIMEHLSGRSVLTVGEMEGFAEAGVIISFYQSRNRVRFEINAAAAERAGLRLSAKLLKLGRLVEEKSP